MRRQIAYFVAVLICRWPAGLKATGAESPAVISISSDDTSVRVQLIDERPAVVSLVCRATGFDWVGGTARAAPIALIDAVEVSGQRRPLHWRSAPQAAADAAPGGRAFRFVCDDPPLELVSSWDARPGPGPVEHRLTIRNRGGAAVLLPVQPSMIIGMQAPDAGELEQWWVDKGAGTPTATGLHTKVVAAGNESLLRCWPSGRDQPRDPIPWISLQDNHTRQGWYAGVEFTARLAIALTAAVPVEQTKSLPLQLRIGLQAEEQFPFFTRLLPGETFESPPVFIGCYRGDVDDGANCLRRWVRANLAPPPGDDRYPLLVNNSWGSGMAVDERLAHRMIDESADLGLEMFHIDAGWFRAVGDWRADPRKFPNGLAPVSAYARRRGLKFGLWVGWTQGGNSADPDRRHEILSVRDPVMAPWFCQKYGTDWKPNEFSGATVCLGEPRAADWCLDTLRRIIKENNLDMIEHDQTIVTDGCEQSSHRHTASRVDAGYRAAQGYYRVYDTLRAEHPGLLFENCVNGGHMIDYGAVRRCHYISITDTYDPLSNRRAFYDASYALPPAMCECYVQNMPVRDLAQFKYMLRSGMMGWCTIMTDTGQWTPEQHDAARRLFAAYKSDLRPLIRDADLFHVSDRPDGVHWDAIEYFDPSAGRGALLAFRGTADEPEHRFVLKGLRPNDTYMLNFEDATNPPATRTGAQLMTAGLTMKLPEPESCEAVHIQRKQ